MFRWGFILIAAMLLPSAACAEEGAAKAREAFAAICSAAIDEKPDLGAIAASVALEPAGGMKDAAITVGRTSLRVFKSPQTKQNIIIKTSSYSDAQEIDCKSTVPAPTDRAELESLAQSLKLEGEFVQVAAVITGNWKRPGSAPLVLVTMLSTASSTVLNMQRIDLSAASSKNK
jgi:hypothetical protein